MLGGVIFKQTRVLWLTLYGSAPPDLADPIRLIHVHLHSQDNLARHMKLAVAARGICIQNRISAIYGRECGAKISAAQTLKGPIKNSLISETSEVRQTWELSYSKQSSIIGRGGF